MPSKLRPHKRWVGYAKEVRGSQGKRYALFVQGKRVSTSSTSGSKTDHKAFIRSKGYMIRTGYVVE